MRRVFVIVVGLFLVYCTPLFGEIIYNEWVPIGPQILYNDCTEEFVEATSMAHVVLSMVETPDAEKKNFTLHSHSNFITEAVGLTSGVTYIGRYIENVSLHRRPGENVSYFGRGWTQLVPDDKDMDNVRVTFENRITIRDGEVIVAYKLLDIQCLGPGD